MDRRGRRIPGCNGILRADGTCLAATTAADDPRLPLLTYPAFTIGPPGDLPGVPPASGSAVLPGYEWSDGGDDNPLIVQDAGGLAYAAFRGPVDRASGVMLPGVLAAFDPEARIIVWATPGPVRVLTALAAGVLIVEGEGVAAVSPDGSTRWTRPVVRPQTVLTAMADDARGQVYLGRSRRDAAEGVTALTASTGRQVWRTRPTEQARVLAVGRGGRVYLAIDAPALRRSIRAVRWRDGTTAWERRVRGEVRSATELPDGAIAVSIARDRAGDPRSRLLLLDPRHGP
ncbi:PQQ-binding-like beta-propeller repeat protein [Miltoncostaea oceani]|uniref:outer membrane protein assembly factor BamB family protein n=1 Tax=Miltoncostaea oceani TaxID=2843216 RepID=UPI001C3E50D3|nr:PQQ-binding-like beta-propeller repeat protein [Miltoncostaea oceani]